MYSKYIFYWNMANTGFFLIVVNTSHIYALLVLFPLLYYYFRKNPLGTLDILLVRLAIVCDVVGYISYVLSPSTTFYMLSAIVVSLGIITFPTLQSMLTHHVLVHKMGQLLGTIGLLYAIARIMMPATFNLIYAQLVGTMASLVLWCLAVTYTVVGVASWCIGTGWEREAKDGKQEHGESFELLLQDPGY
jgi:hypothetical protein